MALKLESSAFAHNEMIPARYTCDGENVSPPLEWSNVPDSTRSFALVFDDPDAPAKTWVHWALYNIPADQRRLDENISPGKQTADGAVQGVNDFKKQGYGGPCPPSGTHRYFMKLYALSDKPDLSPGATKQELLDAIEDLVIDQTELMGTYKRG